MIIHSSISSVCLWHLLYVCKFVFSVPAATMDAPLYGYIGSGMCEDALFLFKTITKEEEDAQARLAAIKEFKRKSRKTALQAISAHESSNISSTGVSRPVSSSGTKSTFEGSRGSMARLSSAPMCKDSAAARSIRQASSPIGPNTINI